MFIKQLVEYEIHAPFLGDGFCAIKNREKVWAVLLESPDLKDDYYIIFCYDYRDARDALKNYRAMPMAPNESSATFKQWSLEEFNKDPQKYYSSRCFAYSYV